ncbi:hypothetical protein KDA_06260 [Dictyobacter alpinus]|uniref:mannan endo-1,4-beta-mannosidase n=1 Tax=Dictyobacter alpinus TaxID=2014873 RepID=A0A402B1C0_9CHLR|nr:cellulase family glycosylhydrolase [Dictyobacter alpinus]GCE25142.1 hypothetical protein KDA_06260 [Dictyobacter alpinus]
MGFIRFHTQGYLQDTEGNPLYVVGINYVASHVCTNFWADWRPEAVERDLKRIAELGLNAIRIPLFWGFNEPEQGVYNELVLTRFQQLIDWAKKYQIYVMPWFLVGVATGDYDVPFRNGRPFFRGEMVDVAERHVQWFISHFASEEQILFWDICDEPEFYSRHPGADPLPYDRRTMELWVKRIYDAIKAVDPHHLVTLGFGHIASEHFGMHIRDMAAILDAMVVTCYPNGLALEAYDEVRNNYFISYNVLFNQLGKPVMTCEAPGASSVLFSDVVIARYYRVALYSNLLNGSVGVLPWVFNDFSEQIWHQTPLNEKTFEPSFGIIAADGSLKPAGKELADFARFVREHHITDYQWPAADTAILVPSGYYEQITTAFKRIYTSFVLLKGTGVTMRFLWDDQSLQTVRLLLVPSSARLTTSAWNALRVFVEQGGTLVFLYDQRTALNTYFNQLFGVEVHASERDHGYGSIQAATSWQDYSQGETVALASTRTEFLRVNAVSATTLFTFEDGHPAVLSNHYGAGTAFLVTAPVLDGLLDLPAADFSQTPEYRLLASLVETTAVNRVVRSHHPAVEVGVMQHQQTGERLLFCINHHSAPIATRIDVLLDQPDQPLPHLIDCRTQEPVPLAHTAAAHPSFHVSLDPGGVSILQWKR